MWGCPGHPLPPPSPLQEGGAQGVVASPSLPPLPAERTSPTATCQARWRGGASEDEGGVMTEIDTSPTANLADKVCLELNLQGEAYSSCEVHVASSASTVNGHSYVLGSAFLFRPSSPHHSPRSDPPPPKKRWRRLSNPR